MTQNRLIRRKIKQPANQSIVLRHIHLDCTSSSYALNSITTVLQGGLLHEGWYAFCCLGHSDISFMLPSLFLFVDEVWQHNLNFPSWDWRILRLPICKEVKLSSNECSEYDCKLSDGEVPVMLEFWGIWDTPSLPLLSGPLCPRVVVPVWVPSADQIELFNFLTEGKQMTDVKLNCYYYIAILETI